MKNVIKNMFLFVFLLIQGVCASPITITTVQKGKKQSNELSNKEQIKIQKKYKTIGLRIDEKQKVHIKELFTTTFLKKYQSVADFVKNPPKHAEHCKVKELDVTRDDQYHARPYFADRASSTLVVVAPGFGMPKELMTPFLEMFPEFDILLVEHRGHGLHAQPQTVADQAAYALCDVVPSALTWGKKEVDDLIAMVTTAKKTRHTKIVGIGFCYSSLIMGAAQVKKNNTLFTHLVFDGLITDLKKTFDLLKHDSHARAQALPSTRLCTKVPGFDGFIKKGIESLASAATHSTLDNQKNCSAITVPTLLWHGTHDVLVGQKDFDSLFASVPALYKMAVVTHNRHLVNHLKEKELYAWTIHQLLEQRQR